MRNDEVDVTGAARRDADEWLVCASAWELLALSFRYPCAELAEAVGGGEWLEAATEIARALGLALPGGWDEGLDGCALAHEQTEPEAPLRRLRAEATRLFVGSPEPVCSPYEGVWRARQDAVAPLLFVNAHSMDVERLLKSCGLGRPRGTNEPVDYIATECEFLQWLCLVNAGALVPQEGVRPPAGTWAATYESFVAEHLAAWVPAFAEAVVANARMAFFASAARLLTGMLDREAGR